MEEKVKQLLKNKDFVEKASHVKTVEEFQKILAAEGIDIPLEEIKSTLEKSNEILQKHSGGEISESELEKISGGALSTDEKVALIVAGILGLSFVGGSIIANSPRLIRSYKDALAK